MRTRVVLLAYVAIATLVSLNMFVPLLIGGHWRPDFTSMWAGARAPDPYDLWAVTKTQAFMFDASKPLPFLYPPSSLPLFYPFGLLPFWPAYALWTAISVAAFWGAARHVSDRAWLALIAPPVVFSLYLGQTALMTGAAIMFAIIHLRNRPMLAGVCLGLAAALKPQTVLLAPFALLVGRHWKAIAAAALTWLLLAAVTADSWLDWWRIVQAFPTMLDRYYPKIGIYAATPVYFAKALGFPTIPFQIAGIILGLVVVWLSFRSTDARVQIIGLVTGTFFAVPYAMGYEVAAMVPAYLALLADGRARSLIIAVPMFPINVVLMVPSLVVSSLATLTRPNRAHNVSEQKRSEEAAQPA